MFTRKVDQNHIFSVVVLGRDQNTVIPVRVKTVLLEFVCTMYTQVTTRFIKLCVL